MKVQLQLKIQKLLHLKLKRLIEQNIYKGTNYESNPLWQASLN